MSTLTEIAQELKDTKEKIVLVYAFNATGKTRLSVEYKNITKKADGRSHTGVCYNAFSEDLFVWDNDEPNNNDNIKLDIVSSSLNQYHSLLLDTDILEETLALSHTKVFAPHSSEMNEEQIRVFSEVFDKLLAKYNFKF